MSKGKLQYEPVDPNRLELAVWEFAGLMLTYWCNARCAFCYVNCGPDRGGDMKIEKAVDLWQSLDKLATKHGKRMRVHLAGGEPFGDWPRLLGTMRAARDVGLPCVQKVETNAYWATDDNIVRHRLEHLDALGMEILIISCDTFHQEYVPIERVQHLVRVGREVLGKGRMIVRWWDFFNNPVDTRRLSDAEKAAAYVSALDQHKERLTGRAAESLSHLFTLHPAEYFENERCTDAVLRSRHVHIDADGRIFPGVCGGIILGTAGDKSVEEVWHELAANWRTHPVVSALTLGGSYALMQAACEFGYEPRVEGYANKCHLCSHVRQFLVDNGIWPEYVGPRECYTNAADRRHNTAKSVKPTTKVSGRTLDPR